MPRKNSAAGSEINKTQIIREHLARDPDAMPKKLSDELQQLGYDVKPQHVSTVKFQMKREAAAGSGISFAPATAATPEVGEETSERKKPGRKKRGRKPREAKPAGAAAPRGEVTYESLCKAKEMADQLGGVSRARQALEALSQLVG